MLVGLIIILVKFLFTMILKLSDGYWLVCNSGWIGWLVDWLLVVVDECCCSLLVAQVDCV